MLKFHYKSLTTFNWTPHFNICRGDFSVPYVEKGGKKKAHRSNTTGSVRFALRSLSQRERERGKKDKTRQRRNTAGTKRRLNPLHVQTFYISKTSKRSVQGREIFNRSQDLESGKDVRRHSLVDARGVNPESIDNISDVQWRNMSQCALFCSLFYLLS